MSCKLNQVSNTQGTGCECMVGFVADDSDTCIPQINCEDGTSIIAGQVCREVCTANNQGYDSTTKTCVACTDNDYFDGTTCTSCTDEQTPNSDRTACITSCPAGAFYNIANDSCDNCPAGQFTSSAGNTSCTPCSTGQFLNIEGGTSCQECPPGQVAGRGSVSCTACNIGQAPDNNRESCQTCPVGTFHNADSHSCEQCSDNSIAATPGLSACEPCPESQFANSSRSQCVTCLSNQILVGEQCRACLLGQTPNAAADGCIDFPFTCPANQIPTHEGTCQSCPSGGIPDETGFICESCPAGQITSSDGLSCEVCLSGEPNNTRTSCTCRADQERINEVCECPSGERNIRDPSSGVEFCALPIEESVDARYNVERCRESGFEASINRLPDGSLAELCHIRISFVYSLDDIVSGVLPTSLGDPESVVHNTPPSPGETSDACLIRSSSSYENDAGYRTCAFIFGLGGGFPRPSSDFHTSSRRLEVLFTPSGETTTIVYDRVRNEQVGYNVISSQSPESGGTDVLLIGFGAVGLIGVLSWYLSDGDLSLFSWSPHLSMGNINSDGISRYSYGSRIDFANENWRTYWTASQSSDNTGTGDWSYGSGATWSEGIIHISHENRLEGLESSMSFSLTAEELYGSWRLRTGLEADLEFTELESTWSSALSFGGESYLGGWELSPSFGTSWDGGTDLGEESYIRLDLSHEL